MAANTVEILSNINKTVSFIATTLSQSSAKKESGMVSSLSKGDVSVKPGGSEGPAALGDPKAAAEVIKILGGLPVEISKIADLGDGTMETFNSVMESLNGCLVNMAKFFAENPDAEKISNKFEKIITSISGGLTKVSEYSSKYPNASKDTENFAKSVEALATGTKKLVAMALLGPVVSVGALMMYPVIGLTIGIFKLVEKANIGKETHERVKELVSGIDSLIKVTYKAAGLVAACLGLGLLIKIGGSELILNGLKFFGITLGALVVVIGVVGFAAKLIKSVGAIEGLNEIMNATLKATALVAICMGLGLLVKAGGQELIMSGLIVLGGVLVTMAALILITGFAGKILKEVGALNGLRDIMIFAFATTLLIGVCLGIGYILSNEKMKKSIINGLIALGAVIVSMIVIILLAGLASKVIQNVGAINSLKTMFILTFATMGLIIAAKYLGDFVTENYESILIGLVSTGGVLLGLVGIAFIAGKFLNAAKKGLVALAVMELLAAGAMLVMRGVVEIARQGDEVGWDNVIFALLSMGGVILEFGVLAGIASFLLPEILLGSIAIAAIELFAFGATLMTKQIIEMINSKEEYELSWGDIFLGVTSMVGIVLEIGVLSLAMIPLLIPLVLAMPSVAMTTIFAFSMIGIVNSVAELTMKIKEAGGIEALRKTVTSDMPSIVKAFSKKNFDLPMSIWDMFRVMGKTKMFTSLVGSITKSVLGIAEIARAAGVVTDDGKLKPFYGIDKYGKPIFGEPVDLVKMAEVICATINTFVSNLNFGFRDVLNMLNSSLIMQIIGTMIDPITKFVDMLMNYKEAGEGYLMRLVVDQEGNIKPSGQPIKVADVAKTIANTIGIFVKELYSEENAATWLNSIYTIPTNTWFGNLRRKSDTTKGLETVAGVLGALVEPVNGFITLITSFTSDDGASLRRVEVQDGKFIVSRPINVNNVARAIVSAISTIVDGIYNDVNITQWSSRSTVFSNVLVGAFGESLNKVIEFGKNLSGEGMDASKISSVATALVNGLAGIGSTKFLNISVEDLRNKVDSIRGLVNLFSGQGMFAQTTLFSGNMVNDITEDINSLSVSVDNGTKKFAEFKKTFRAVDDLIIKESEKRKKAINDTTKAIQNMLSKISGAKDDVAELNSLLRRLEELDANSINNNANGLNLRFGGASVGGGASTSGNSQPAFVLDYDRIRKAVHRAIYDAFSTAGIRRTQSVAPVLSNDDYATLIDLISKLEGTPIVFENIKSPN